MQSLAYYSECLCKNGQMLAVDLHHNAQNWQTNSSVNRWKCKVQTCESDRFLIYVQ